MLGHNNKEETRKTAKTISWNLKPGNMESFYSCAADNEKQKNPKRIEQNQKLIRKPVFTLMLQL